MLYLGYDSTGEPTWFSYAGELQASEKPGVNWVIEGELMGFTGGNAFNQDYQAPEAAATSNQIKIDFHHSHYASIQVNGGAVQRIIPINHSTHTTKEFEETDQVFPELTGNWSFVISKQAPSNDLNNYDGRSFYMKTKETTVSEDGTKTVKYQFSHSSSKPSVVTPVVNTVFENEGLVCSNPPNSNTGVRQVKCWIEDFPTKGETMQVAPGDIGANYIFGQNQAGDTFEAFRFDYLPSL